MRQFRLTVIALITSLAVINAVFLRKTIAVLLTGIHKVNQFMHRIRFWLLGIVSFIIATVATIFISGSFLNRLVLAVSCTIFSFNSTFCTPNLEVESDRAMAVPSAGTIPQYNFDLVARSGLIIDGQKIVHLAGFDTWKYHRLIDESGHIVFQDQNGTIFRDNKAVASKGQKIGSFIIKEVKDYFLFKDGTLDIALTIGADDRGPSWFGHNIIIRNGKTLPLSEDKNFYLGSGSFDVVKGYPNTYFADGISRNSGHVFLKDGITEVSQKPQPIVVSNLPNTAICVANEKNQRVCSSSDSGYLVRDGGKYLPGLGSPVAINNSGRVITSYMQILDYEKDALPSFELALEKSGERELDKISERLTPAQRQNLNAADQGSPIYANVSIPHRVKIPYEKLLGTTLNSLIYTYGIITLQLTDSGYMAIVLNDPKGAFVPVIIRATPSGSQDSKPKGFCYSEKFDNFGALKNTGCPSAPKGICGAVSAINSFVFLKNEYRNIYGNNLTPFYDSKTNTDERDANDFADKGWKVANSKRREGYYPRARNHDGNVEFIKTLNDWINDHVPNAETSIKSWYEPPIEPFDALLYPPTYNRSPTIDDLKQEIKNNSAVQLLIYNGSGKKHFINLTGISCDANSNCRIKFQDPNEPTVEGDLPIELNSYKKWQLVDKENMFRFDTPIHTYSILAAFSEAPPHSQKLQSCIDPKLH